MTGGGIIDMNHDMLFGWQYVPDLVLRGARAIGRKLINRSEINLPSSSE